MAITNYSERLIEKENGKFYATDYTGYMVTTIDNKFDFIKSFIKDCAYPQIHCKL